MKTKVKFAFIFSIILFIIFFSIYIKKNNVNNQTDVYKTSCGEYEKSKILINSITLSVNVADTACKRQLGLSGLKSLKDNEGMFFIFNTIGFYPFWMKDMLFSIDILWIGNDFKVVGIEKDVSLNTYPKAFGEKYLAKYVLEIPAGYSEKNNIKIGDKLSFYKN